MARCLHLRCNSKPAMRPVPFKRFMNAYSECRVLLRWILGCCLVVCLTLPCQSATVLVAADSVPPVGWRRTSQGWERLDQDPGWMINEWIRYQKAEESENRLLGIFDSLSVVHPVSFAAGQLAVAFFLTSMSRRRKEVLT